jgi:hypothetical protein
VPVNSTAPYIEYEGDGVLLSFAIPFTFTSNTQLSVILVDELTGEETDPLTEGIEYTVTGGDPGTEILFVTEPTADQIVRIDRVTPRTQPDSFATKQTYMTASLEAHLDRNTRILQEMQALLDRTIHFKKSIDPSEVSGEVEAFVPDDAADCVLAFNSSGTGIVPGPSKLDIENTAAFADAAEASSLSAASSASDAATSAAAAAASEASASGSATAAAASATSSAASATSSAASAASAAATVAAAIAAFVPMNYGTSASPTEFINGSQIIGPEPGKYLTIMNFSKQANGLQATLFIDPPDLIGQRMIAVRHDSGTDVVSMDTNVARLTYLNGEINFGKNGLISLISPDGIIWVEEYRNGF